MDLLGAVGVDLGGGPVAVALEGGDAGGGVGNVDGFGAGAETVDAAETDGNDGALFGIDVARLPDFADGEPDGVLLASRAGI